MHFSAWIIQSVCSTLNCLKECRLVGLSGHILKGYIKFVKVRSIFMHWPKNMGEKSMAKKIADTIYQNFFNILDWRRSSFPPTITSFKKASTQQQNLKENPRRPRNINNGNSSIVGFIRQMTTTSTSTASEDFQRNDFILSLLRYSTVVQVIKEFELFQPHSNRVSFYAA